MASNDNGTTKVVSNATIRPATGHLTLDGLVPEVMIKGGVNKPAVTAKPLPPPGQGPVAQPAPTGQPVQTGQPAQATEKPAGKSTGS